MSHAHEYTLRGNRIHAMQVNPSYHESQVRAFCPSYTLNDKLVYGADKGNGLVWPQNDDRPVQEFADRPFFWIRNPDGDWIAGNVYDWIIQTGKGRFEIRTDGQFCNYYEAV